MSDVRSEIQAMVDRERAAWDALDAEALIELLHPDMIWPFPPTSQAHDPADWIFPFGRFDRARWTRDWAELFRTHELVRNERVHRTAPASSNEAGRPPPA